MRTAHLDRLGGPEKGRLGLWIVDDLGRGLLVLSLAWQKHSLNVWQHTTLRNGDPIEQSVQLLIITDSQLEMSGDDSGFLVVTGSISSQLKNLSSKVFHDSGEVDWCTSSYTLSIVALSQQTVDSANWELKSSSG